MQTTFGAVVGMEPVVDSTPDHIECEHCGALSADCVEIDGAFYCPDCVVECADCGENMRNEDSADSEDGTHYCQQCYDEHFTHCNDCNAELERDDCTTSEDGNDYCKSCYDERFTHCTDCGNEVKRRDCMTDEGGDDYCHDCYYDRYTTCDSCNAEILRDEAYCNDNGTYCEGCYSERDGEWDSRHFHVATPTYVEIRSTRKFGIELETSECGDYFDLDGETKFGCKEDGSIDGKEFVSPVLYGDEGLSEIRRFCRLARNFKVDGKCGFHAHLDMGDLTVAQLKAVAYAYHKTYAIWAAFVADSRRSNHYCGAHDYDRSGLSAIADSDDWRSFCNRDRYVWCNVAAYNEHKSIEIRLHSATLEPEKIVNWIKAHVRFIDVVKDMTFGQIERRLSGPVESLFSALSRIWDDSELSAFYADRAEKFGTIVAQPATV